MGAMKRKGGRAGAEPGSRRARRAKKAVGGGRSASSRSRGSQTVAREGRAARPRDCFASVRRGRLRASERASGFGVSIAVVEGWGGGWDVAEAKCDWMTVNGRAGGQRGGRGGERVVRGLRALSTPAKVRVAASVGAALGHTVRLTILRRLMEGPTSYRELQECTGMKAGPLYHHVNQLRLAFMLRPKRRDHYEITRGGRNGLLVVLAATSITHDRRARPAAK